MVLLRVSLLPVLAVSAFLCLIGPASAGDISEHRIIGFSPDGSVFAFEEFGIQDGSGFPYASIYMLDTETDRWLPGTPFHILDQEENAGLAETRRQARSAADALLSEHEVTDNWMDLAHSPLGEMGGEAVRLAFAAPQPHNALADPEETYEATLDLYYAETRADLNCVLMIGDRPMGFRLKLARRGGLEHVLHQDELLPESRGCPITYRLSRVVTMRTYPVEKVMILLSIIRKGFEGADRRFIAIPAALPE